MDLSIEKLWESRDSNKNVLVVSVDLGFLNPYIENYRGVAKFVYPEGNAEVESFIKI